MYNLSFKSRIAFNYIISTALLTGVVFMIIYVVVKISVSNHLDQDLQREVDRHSKEIEVKDGAIALRKHKEWMEREHNTVGVDPVFIEFLNAEGKIIDKSPNLKDSELLYTPNYPDNIVTEGKLADKKIRQEQMPIYEDDEIAGYLLVAVSIEGSTIVLETLRHILLISYPFILLILFLVARVIAGRSIKPINDIIDTSNAITRDNLISRIPLPHNKDELYILSDTINNLLDRVEQVIEREKSFTSYASHEFRTPLAVLKGTLEVLIRKPRGQEEYEEKINYCIKEVDRLNHLVDELLILTRYENQKLSLKLEEVAVENLLSICLNRFSGQIQDKNIQIHTNVIPVDIKVKTDTYLFSTIINNIVSNAIKYSGQGGIIRINVTKEKNTLVFVIKDNGIGIAHKDLDKIFDKFYRSYENDHPQIKGFGLGLAIVKRFCELLQIKVEIASQETKGTAITLVIPQS